MSEDDMVERVARAISDWDGNDPDELYCKEPYWRRYEEGARASIAAYKSALADAELVIVPRDPIEAMRKARDRLLENSYPENWDDDILDDAWRAMIDAALNSPSEHPLHRPAQS